MIKTAAVITISDKGSRGERIDTSGPALCGILKENGWDVVYTSIIPDEKELIKEELILCADIKRTALVLTTGGTGFSPRDITPEATEEVIERKVPGIPEVMRSESMKITPHGCLSRSAAGIRKSTLIINLPGSKKAAGENFLAVLKPVCHGVEMIQSSGSADCAEHETVCPKKMPSVDEWIKEAKKDKDADKCGMYLFHNGVVRSTSKEQVREGKPQEKVKGMLFHSDKDKVDKAVENTYRMPGIYYVRVWLNEGQLETGDDIMLVLVGGDIRPHVADALSSLVGEIKEHCVTEKELLQL